ncbi:hypothetical protein B0H14DRAFT_3660414 [Mycena olivaceomarginata]|nr:hypothetical protein B0H14DRAFT_3660414 [Mycena olivaceomarginata]
MISSGIWLRWLAYQPSATPHAALALAPCAVLDSAAAACREESLLARLVLGAYYSWAGREWVSWEELDRQSPLESGHEFHLHSKLAIAPKGQNLGLFGSNLARAGTTAAAQELNTVDLFCSFFVTQPLGNSRGLGSGRYKKHFLAGPHTKKAAAGVTVQKPGLTVPASYHSGCAAAEQIFLTLYKKFVFGHEELQPISKSSRDDLGGWGASVVDAMDLFNEAVNFSSRIDFSTIPAGGTISVFETTIRPGTWLKNLKTLSRQDILLETRCVCGDGSSTGKLMQAVHQVHEFTVSGGKLLNNQTIINIGLELNDAPALMKQYFSTGISPEGFAFIESEVGTGNTITADEIAFYNKHGFYITSVSDSEYHQRPEGMD